jgi:hypothetical protein
VPTSAKKEKKIRFTGLQSPDIWAPGGTTLPLLDVLHSSILAKFTLPWLSVKLLGPEGAVVLESTKVLYVMVLTDRVVLEQVCQV